MFHTGVQCVIRKKIVKEPDVKKNNNNQRKYV